MSSKCDLILVAGGASHRYQGKLPKQFESVNGRPLYLWSLDVFLNWPNLGNVVVVVPEDWVSAVRDSFNILTNSSAIQVVAGGTSRQISATRGLEALSSVTSNEWVMVHDGARPCITKELLDRVWAAREAGLKNPHSEIGGVVPGWPANETIKIVDEAAAPLQPSRFDGDVLGVVRETLPRSNLVVIQTPQLLKRQILAEAYGAASGFEAVDDASLVEKRGFKVVVARGDYDNVKVTFSEDIERVSSWLRKRHPQI